MVLTSHKTAPAGREAIDRNRVRAILHRLLEEGLAVELAVTGASMSPFLRSGDLVTLVPPECGSLQPGDVIAFLAGGRFLVIHRIVARDGESLRTRGDALTNGDSPVALSEILGRVSKIERRGRRSRLGLGPERFLIARLSERGWLAPLFRPWRWFARRLG